MFNSRLSKHVDTLFRITHSSNFNTSIQSLMLIQQLSVSHQISADRFYRTLYESLLDPRVITSSKQSLYLNLLYKALKADLNVKRVKAFVKRLVQISGLHQPSFVCGAFYLVQELGETFPGVNSLVDQSEEHGDAEEEVFKDVLEDGEEAREEQPSGRRYLEPDSLHSGTPTSHGYDSRKRDPEHSNADKSCLWELSPFLVHFHPSVSVSAQHLLRHEKVPGKADLTLHTLIHFLDRFVYRNPKSASSGLRGSSIMQPLAGGDASGSLLAANATSRLQAPVNTEAFRKKGSATIAADDVFFHDYFNRIGKEKLGTRKKKKDVVTEEQSESDEEAESEIWKALVDSRPDLEGGNDSDQDLDMDDLESEFDRSDVELEDIDTEAVGDNQEMELGDDHDVFEVDESDEDALGENEDDIPSDLDEDDDGEPGESSAKSSSKQSWRTKQRKFQLQPTFASADDYSAMLENDDGEDLG